MGSLLGALLTVAILGCGPEVASPTAPPVPSPAADVASALAFLRLPLSPNVTIAGENSIRQSAGHVFLGPIDIANRSTLSYRIPAAVTTLRWNGAWVAVPCPSDVGDASNNANGMCATVDIETQGLMPRESITGLDPRSLFEWPLIGVTPPGIYALVLPVWQSDQDFPIGAPTEGAGFLVTIR